MTTFETAHAILRKALREVAEADRPEAPPHAGGPLLSCPALDQIRISMWCEELLHARAAPGEVREIRQIRALVESFLAAPTMVSASEWAKRAHGAGAMEGKEAYRHAALEDAGTAKRGDSAAMTCARRAASGAAAYSRGKPDLVFTSATVAATRTAKELALAAHPMPVRAFLEALDAKLMGFEFAAAYRERVKDAPPAVERVLFRAADDKAKMAHWIVRFASGSYGYLGKLPALPKPKWSFVEGTRDDVLASAPDALFAAATTRVLAEDRPSR